jgi:tetratricopeptide (TPR) repeat protein
MKRGHLFLEDSDWQQAAEYFDKVLDIDPEYAPAYVGKLCAELNVRSEADLGDLTRPFSDLRNFELALRFADNAYRKTLEGYDRKVVERMKQEQREQELAVLKQFAAIDRVNIEKFGAELLSDLIPKNSTPIRRHAFGAVLSRHGIPINPSDKRFVVISWQGCNMDDPRVEMFAQKLVPSATIDNLTRDIRDGMLARRSNADIPSQVPHILFNSVLTVPRLMRMFGDMYSDEQKLQGFLIGSDGQSTALLVTLTEEAPRGKEFARVLEAIKKIGQECGVDPQIHVVDSLAD